MTDFDRLVAGAVALASVGALLALPIFAYARNSGQYAQLDPGTRQWFGEQHAPGSLSSCCSTADGTQAEEDIRYDENGVGHIWVRFIAVIMLNDVPIGEEAIDWMEVPEKAIIPPPYDRRAPSQPIVWWAAQWDDSRAGMMKHDEGGKPLIFIRCFKPGGRV